MSQRHLERVLRVYVGHYNTHRPHRSLGQRTPAGISELEGPKVVDLRGLRRRDRLGGLIHEYEIAA